MSGARWKNQERAVAGLVGGQRLPNVGRGQPDVRLPGWGLQIKTRHELPAWLWSAMAQAERDAGPEERAALILCEVRPGVRTKRLAVLDFDLFAALIGTENANKSQPSGGSVPGANRTKRTPNGEPMGGERDRQTGQS